MPDLFIYLFLRTGERRGEEGTIGVEDFHPKNSPFFRERRRRRRRAINIRIEFVNSPLNFSNLFRGNNLASCSTKNQKNALPFHGEPLRNAINVAFLRVCAGIGSNGSARYSSASRIRDDNACFEQFRETWIQRSDNRGEEYVSVELAESREGKFVLNDRNIPLRNGISNFLLSISVEIADRHKAYREKKRIFEKG